MIGGGENIGLRFYRVWSRAQSSGSGGIRFETGEDSSPNRGGASYQRGAQPRGNALNEPCWDRTSDPLLKSAIRAGCHTTPHHSTSGNMRVSPLVPKWRMVCDVEGTRTGFGQVGSGVSFTGFAASTSPTPLSPPSRGRAHRGHAHKDSGR